MTFSTFQSKSSTLRIRGEAPYQVHALETLVRIQHSQPLVLCRSITKTTLRERMDFVDFNYHRSSNSSIWWSGEYVACHLYAHKK